LVPEQHLLIVSDYGSVVARIAELLHLLDQPPQVVTTQFVQLKNIDVTVLQPQVQQILAARDKAQATPSGQTGTGLELLSDTRTNQLILIGAPEKVTSAQTLATSLDVPLPLQTHVYTLRSMDPDRLDKLVKQLIDPLDAKRLYQSATDKDSGMLIVTTTDAIHKRIADLKEQLDVPISEAASPIQFYKLTNTTAADVLATIRSLEGEQNKQVDSSGTESGSVSPVTNSSSGSTSLRGQSATPAPSAQTPPANPLSPVTGQSSQGSPGYRDTSGASGNAATALPLQSSTGSQAILGVHTSRGTITADPNTNTIIIEADQASQKVYESLIRMLDKRRPQVLIECTLVTLDTSNNFSLGVELGGESTGKPKIITFNSFGLSTPNPTTGILSLIAGAGFNGTLLNSDIASVVVQALQTNSHSKVLSAPRILVNDNATGTLSSVAEQPFTSVNASTTVATTSFAGYATAGTSITLTPHISEGDHLQLEYTVSLNNFTGSGSNGVPPPRQTDSVQSKITIPDGSTVVVGGLNSSNFSQGRQTIPFLGDIPFLRFLISQQNKTSGNSTLFVFIRPLILRDDQFQDLKYLSERDVASAGIPGDFPLSQPLLIR
jgi:general secretion pathway protein D